MCFVLLVDPIPVAMLFHAEKLVDVDVDLSVVV